MDPLDSFKSEVSVSLMFNLATDKVLRILFLEFKRYDNEAGNYNILSHLGFLIKLTYLSSLQAHNIL